LPMLIGVDIGTTGTKAVLMDENGNIISEAYKRYDLYSDKSGYVEQNTEDWWDAVLYTIKSCIKDIGNKSDIKAIALSTQGGSMVPVDINGNPLSRAVIWMDRRGQKQTDDLLSGKDKNFYYYKTGWRLSNCLNLVQIKWLKDNKPELFKSAYKFISTVEYINFKFTDKFVIDPSNAGMTQLFNITDKKWDEEILDDLNIGNEKLGEILESGEVIGTLKSEAAKALELPESVKIISGGHDQYCAALGAGTFNNGDILLSTGTAWVLLGIFSKPIFDTKTFFAPGNHVIQGKWGALGTVPTAGVSMEWFKNNIGLGMDIDGGIVQTEEYKDIDKKAKSKKPGSEGVMFFPHFTGSGSPTWSMKSKAAVLGLELNHDRYNIARALMEGVVYDINLMLEAMNKRGEKAARLKVLGGASRSSLWVQITADVTGISVFIPESKNTACIGAAILAGKGSGLFSSISEGYDKFKRKEEVIVPDKINHEIYCGLYELYKKRFDFLKSCYDL
jgi:sugar (pentulose or hexulose) kinase